MEELKQRHFGSHPDEPVILHRKELANQSGAFRVLLQDKPRQRFDTDLLTMLTALDYTVITVALDKATHLQRYGRLVFDPYHYCLRILLERYLLHLESLQATGDVLAEARGKREDRRLSAEFARLCSRGTGHLGSILLDRHLTTGELKLQSKKANVPGLQLADLLLNQKLGRHPVTGEIRGYGIKLVP